MKNINEIDIKITRAEVTSVKISLNDGEWGMDIRGKLVSETGHSVSDFYFSSDGYGQSKIDLPIEATGLGNKLFTMSQPLIIKKIQGHFNSLGSGVRNEER